MLGGIGPTDFDAEPQIQDHARNDGIPLGDVAILAPGERDGFWPVKHGEQRNAPQRREVRHQCARERLDLFIRDDRHLDPPRVLQARRKEMHAPLGAVEKADKDLPEVMLRELARHPLEAHDGPRRRRPHRAHQGVQRTFRAIISRSWARRRSSTLSSAGSSVNHPFTCGRYAAAFDGRPTGRAPAADPAPMSVIIGSALTRCTLRFPTPVNAAISCSVWPARRRT